MKKTYTLANVGNGAFVILWKNAGHSYWSKYGSATFTSEIEARRAAAVDSIIL